VLSSLAAEEGFIILKRLMVHDCEGQTILYATEGGHGLLYSEGRRKDQRFTQCFDRGKKSERANSDIEKCPRNFVSEDIQEVGLQIDGSEYASLVAWKTNLWEKSYSAFCESVSKHIDDICDFRALCEIVAT
jgi:hypothetical protein